MTPVAVITLLGPGHPCAGAVCPLLGLGHRGQYTLRLFTCEFIRSLLSTKGVHSPCGGGDVRVRTGGLRTTAASLKDHVHLLSVCALLMAPAGAIIVSAVTGASFAVCVLVALPVAMSALVVLAIRAPSGFAVRARIGLLSGLLGLAAYDLIRLLLQITGVVSNPFRAITLYGRSLLPDSPAAASAFGWGYHIWNGLTFAIFFVILANQPTVLKGVLWALLLDSLQTLTVTKVPGIDLGREFLTASIVGHLAYGATLGGCAGRRIRTLQIT